MSPTEKTLKWRFSGSAWREAVFYVCRPAKTFQYSSVLIACSCRRLFLRFIVMPPTEKTHQ
jgi:hypothetical protein